MRRFKWLPDLSQIHSYGKLNTHQPFENALTGELTTKTFLFLGFSFTDPNLTNEQLPNLFNKYYPSLENISRLSLGSGLEGFIAKSVADRLNIPIDIKIVNHQLVFIMRLSKKPRK